MTDERQVEAESEELSEVTSEAISEVVDGELSAGLDPASPDSVDETDRDQQAADDADGSEDEPAAELSAEAMLVRQLESELVEAQAEALGHMDKLQRLAAEFQNSKKRQERQLSEAIQRAGEHMVQRLLPVLDDFDLAFDNVPAEIDEDGAPWVEGFRQIQAKLNTILSDQGLSAIASDGEFDPNLHEAITSEPSDDVESGHIIETLRVGYEYKGRVLRPAMVRVAS